jgi:hypothetical protein
MMDNPPSVGPSNQDVRDPDRTARLARRFVAEHHQIAGPGNVASNVHNGRTHLQMQRTARSHLGPIPGMELVTLSLADDEVGREHIPDGDRVIKTRLDPADVPVGECRVDAGDQTPDLIGRLDLVLVHVTFHVTVEPGLTTPSTAATITSAQIA